MDAFELVWKIGFVLVKLEMWKTLMERIDYETKGQVESASSFLIVYSIPWTAIIIFELYHFIIRHFVHCCTFVVIH